MKHNKSIFIVCGIDITIYDDETKEKLEFQSINEELDFLSERLGIPKSELTVMLEPLADQTNRYNTILNALARIKKESLN